MPGAGEQEDASVGFASYNRLGSDDAIGARPVLHNDRHVPPGTDLLGHQSCDGIERRTGSVRLEKGQLLRRPLSSARSASGEDGEGDASRGKTLSQKVHDAVSWVCLPALTLTLRL